MTEELQESPENTAKDFVWTAGYQQGRRDLAMSSRIQTLESRFDAFEVAFKQGIAALSADIATLSALVSSLNAAAVVEQTKREKWMSCFRWVGMLVYRATMVAGWLMLFASHPEMAKAGLSVLLRLVF